MFHKKAILKQFVIFTGKHLCWGLLFNKVAGHQDCNFIKKRLQHRYFLANIRKFIRRPILKNICKKLHFWKVFYENIFQMGSFKKYVRSKLPVFDPSHPLKRINFFFFNLHDHKKTLNEKKMSTPF